MTAEQLKLLLEKELSCCTAHIVSEDNVHFEAIIISDQFNGLTKIKQQQLVNALVYDYITSGELHALTMKTYTPEKWARLNQE